MQHHYVEVPIRLHAVLAEMIGVIDMFRSIFAAMIFVSGIAFLSAAQATNNYETASEIRSRETIELEYPEVYELANIIIALSDHGIEDPLSVQQDSEYYRTMREWFDPYRDHPVIESANYSRERWEEFLSFRTDAYAFVFDENDRLVRTSDFHAFPISAFDDHLQAIEDFARQSRFREFFASHSDYREEVIQRYRQFYMMEEMRAFLEAEFGNIFENRRYVVALSPFVGSQNLHRDIDDTLTVDFPPMAGPVRQDGEIIPMDQARSLHTLFTEMDHGYVNPTTERHAVLVEQTFDPEIWAGESGYEEYTNAVFNEYMTWAVYDLFVRQEFPHYAHQLSYDWHVINEGRGFRYSHFFAQQLIEIYEGRQPGQTLSDLYPSFIERVAEFQGQLSKPTITNASDVYSVEADTPGWIEITFSEPMTPTSSISYVIKQERHEDVMGTANGENIRWNDDRTSVQLMLSLDASSNANHGIMFNTRGMRDILTSAQGVALSAHSYRLVQARSLDASSPVGKTPNEE